MEEANELLLTDPAIKENFLRWKYLNGTALLPYLNLKNTREK